MKAFALATALLPLVALAAPMNDGYKKEDQHDMKPKGDHDSWDDGKDSHGMGMLHKGPFYFTSTYSAYATPDQV